MKKGFIKSLMVAVVLVIGCSEDASNDIQIESEMSEAVADYLKLKFGNQNSTASLESNIADPANNSFTSMLGNFGFGGGRLDSADADIIIYDDPWEWVSCAVVTSTDNADGSKTEIYDYGDGCFEGSSEYQYWIHGKYTSTYKNTYNQTGDIYADDYYYNVVYDNYGGIYNDEYLGEGEYTWLTNGYNIFSGNSVYNESTGVFTGNYHYDSETIYEYGVTKYYSKSMGSSTYDQDKFIVDGINEYESLNDPNTENDYYYKSSILEPLVYDYSCYQNYYAEGSVSTSSYWFFAYVSGVEEISFRENGVSGKFTIDYGTGDCDNLVIITENGKEYEIDIVDLYKNS